MVENKIVDIIETKNISLKGYTLIEGFPGLGLSGTIGAKYIVEKFDFIQFGHIDSPMFMPIIRIQKGVPTHPARIYYNKKLKMVIVLSEQVINSKLAPFIAKELTNWIEKKGIKKVISTSGIKTNEETKIYAFASDEQSKKDLKKQKIKMIENGVSEGVTALIMLHLKDKKIDAYCLLGNTKLSADYWAATELVKTISSLTNMSIDVKPLIKEAKLMETALKKHLNVIKNVESKKSNSPKLSMYS